MFWNKPGPNNHPLGVKKGQDFFNHVRLSNFNKLEADIL